MRRPSHITITPEAIESAIQRIDAAILGRGAILLEPSAALDLAPYLRVRSLALDTEEQPPVFERRGDVAIVAIDGPLAQREVTCLSMTLLDGYDAIERRATAAMGADDVGAVVLRIDSPGGDAAGCLELVDALAGMAAESGKPLVAYADEMAASAAYWIASAGPIVIPRSGVIGSIGAVVAGVNEAGALERAGLRAIIAAYPSGKAAGWAAELKPLDSPEAIKGVERMQARAKEIGGLFAADVATRRGTTIDAILGLDAAMFSGQAAVDAGLADHVGGMGAAIRLARSKIKRKAYSMPGENAAASAADKVLALLCGAVGLDVAAATPEAVEAATRRTKAYAELGEKVAALAGVHSSEALGVVESWKQHALVTLPATREDLKRREVQLAVSTGRLTPGQAYDPGEEGSREYPSKPRLRADLASMSLEAVQRKCELAAPAPETLRLKSPRRRIASIDEAAVKRAGFASVAEYLAALDKFGPAPGEEIAQ